jgi:hypothetical protein
MSIDIEPFEGWSMGPVLRRELHLEVHSLPAGKQKIVQLEISSGNLRGAACVKNMQKHQKTTITDKDCR